MGRLCDIINGLKPMMMMVTVQVALTGVTIFFKIAGSYGMSLPVIIAYRYLFAAAAVVPLALFLERKRRSKLTWKIVLHAFACALFGGSLAQNLYAASLMMTSATFVAALANLVPALTFILAIIFRMEALGLKTRSGQAKLMGTVLSLGGAMLLTFYKGFELFSTNFNLLPKSGHVAASHNDQITVLGFMLALGSTISVALGLIVQAKMSAIYPCHYSSTALISIMGSIQAFVYALCVERDWNQWKLGWNLRLLASSYMGIIASGLMWVFIMSCVRMRGPLFVSIFNPLLLVFVAIAGCLLLNEKLHLGSVLGAVVIIAGLYLVLWGKGKEMKKMSRLVPSTTGEGATTTLGESFKILNHGSNVLVVTPSFISEAEIIDSICDEEEDEVEDLEAFKVSNTTQNKS